MTGIDATLVLEALGVFRARLLDGMTSVSYSETVGAGTISLPARSAIRLGITALVIAAVLTPLVKRWLERRNNFDVPSERSSHSVPIPRGGGIALIVGTCVASVTVSHGARSLLIPLLAGGAIGILGLVEDLRGLSALQRLTIQLVIGVAAGVGLAHGEYSTFTALVIAAAIAGFLAVMCNVVNFMDGINGISAAQGVCAGVAYAIYGGLEGVVALEVGGLALVGAALGFVPFNFPRAQIFLGDSGSYFLGAWLALLASLGFVRGLNPVVLLVPYLVYLADTTFTLFKRFQRSEALMQPHKEHAYQRLVQAGWSHAKTTQLVFVLIGGQALTALVFRHAPVFLQVVAGLMVVASVVAYLFLPWMLSRRSVPSVTR